MPRVSRETQYHKKKMTNIYDVLVVGGGHAGIEAAMACTRIGVRTALVSMEINTIGRLSCNPSIGGSAKGHLAKEIDALGGVMARLADLSGLQFKLLNTSKGPAVWSPRCQNDKDLYPLFAQNLLLSTPDLHVIRETVAEIIVERGSVAGIRTESGETIRSQAVILCSGTFLNAIMWTGMEETAGGRFGERSSNSISNLLASHGLEKGRLKTGTPPRIDAISVDYSQLKSVPGDDSPLPLSIHTHKVRNTVTCWQTTTCSDTHEILRTGFDKSPMFTGAIKGSGPRYCPSIEDKISRFSDKPFHTIVLEPETFRGDTLYVNGFSTSLPMDIQQRGLRSIPGLEKCSVSRFGYAVEYDFFYPYQLKCTLESKAIKGLFLAGQVNGTSGYEEAASQGLIAGINAARMILDQEPFTLGRNEAYIGVLIDDLVNKNTNEPYRIFTSLAEFRLLLRIDTVYDRLLPKGREIGLIGNAAYSKYCRTRDLLSLIAEESERKVSTDVANSILLKADEEPVTETTVISTLVKRPKVSLLDALKSNSMIPVSVLEEHSGAVDQIQHTIKYQGYIDKQLRDVERMKEIENIRIPESFSYNNIRSLSLEAREKLEKIRPSSIGQASRISGVSASDISVLTVYLGR